MIYIAFAELADDDDKLIWGFIDKAYCYIIVIDRPCVTHSGEFGQIRESFEESQMSVARRARRSLHYTQIGT